MKISEQDYELLYKKLEYKFKNSGNELVNKIKNKESLSKEDIELLLKKLEYTFRKSEHEILTRLSKMAGLENYSTVKFSNIKSKKLKDVRDKLYKKNEMKHLDNFKDFNKNL